MYTASLERDGLLPDTVERPVQCGIAAESFFEALQSDSRQQQHLYFTAPVTWPKLLDRAKNWESLATSAAIAEDLRASAPWLQCWAATAGAYTQAHYDVADNVFVQLSGRKEFLLWPPSQARALHLYPDAHPRARKAQLDCIDAPDLRRFPLASRLLPPARFVLSPGDALAIPAFWFHHVVSHTACTSLNVFCESPVKLAAAELLGVSLPVHAAWPRALKRDALFAAVAGCHAAAGSVAQESLDTLLDSRFAPLGHSSGDPGGASGGTAAAAAARPRPRRRPPPAPEGVESLRPALLVLADDVADGVARLREAVQEAAAAHDERWVGLEDVAEGDASGDASTDAGAHGTAEAHFVAVRDLTLLHLVEAWTVKAFGPGALEAELRELRRRCK